MTDQFDIPPSPQDPRKWRESIKPWARADSYQAGATDEPMILGPDGQPVTPPNIEDFAPTPRVPPTGFELMPAPGSAWIANIVLSLMVFACMINWSWHGNQMQPMTASGEAVFKHGEYWRLVTALFGHGDVMHLLHNAPIYWFFAWVLNAYFGVFVAGVLTIIVGVISNAFTVWSYEPNMQLLGASGMIYGMVAMWLVLYIRFDRRGWWVKRVMRSFGFSLLVLFPQTFEANVSYLAHASGFVAGLGVAVCWLPFAMKFAPVRNEPYYRWSDA